jgi:hypothetical protein
LQDYPKTFFSTPSFLKGSFEIKNSYMKQLEILIHSLQVVFPKKFSHDYFLFIIFFEIYLDGLHQTIFANMLWHLFCNMILNISKIIQIEKLTYGLRNIKNYLWILINKIKRPT